MKRTVWIACVLLFATAEGQCKSKDKLGPDLSGSWPTTMTMMALEDAGVLQHTEVDVTATRTRRLASERLSKYMWHQLYFVTFRLNNGDTVSAIADIDYSPIADMNMGPIVYAVSKTLQPDGKPEPPKR